MASLNNVQFALRSALVLAAATAFATAPVVDTEARVESDAAPVLIAPSIAGPIFADTLIEAELNAANTGACCFSNGLCSVMKKRACINAGGIFQGIGTDCSVACPPPGSGACCINGTIFMPAQCLDLTAADCALNNGVFLGAGTSCVEAICPIAVLLGSCCITQGPFTTCIDTSEADCEARGGVFNPGVPCFLIFCIQVPPATGACCITSLATCVETNALDCVLLNGQYQGDGTTCVPLPCDEF